MIKKIEKLKLSIHRLAFSFTISLIVFLLVEIIFIIAFSLTRSWFLLAFMIVFGLLIYISLSATIGGFIFLKANKNWKEACKVKKKSALEWGLVYWKYTARIDVIAEECKIIDSEQEIDGELLDGEQIDV